MWIFIPGASGEVEKQVLQNVMNCFCMLTTNASVFFFQTGKARWKTTGSSKGSHAFHKAREHCTRTVTNKHYKNFLEQYLKDNWYLQKLQSQDSTDENAK